MQIENTSFLGKLAYRMRIYLNSFKYRLLAIRSNTIIPLSTLLIIHPGGKVTMGGSCTIGRYATISVLPGAELKIGSNTIINHCCTIYCANSIIIGEDVRIAHNTTIVDHDYDTSNFEQRFIGKLLGKINIQKNAWIGASCVLLRDTSLGDYAVVGAGSIIKGEFPGFSIIKNHRDIIVTTQKKPPMPC